jgi:hypothetical protein
MIRTHSRDSAGSGRRGRGGVRDGVPRRSSIRVDLIATIHHNPVFKDVAAKNATSPASYKSSPAASHRRKRSEPEYPESESELDLPGYQSRGRSGPAEYEEDYYGEIFSDHEKDAFVYKGDSSDNDYTPSGGARVTHKPSRRTTRRSSQQPTTSTSAHMRHSRSGRTRARSSEIALELTDDEDEGDVADMLQEDSSSLGDIDDFDALEDSGAMPKKRPTTRNLRQRTSRSGGSATKTHSSSRRTTVNGESPFGGRLRERKAVNYYIPPPPAR